MLQFPQREKVSKVFVILFSYHHLEGKVSKILILIFSLRCSSTNHFTVRLLLFGFILFKGFLFLFVFVFTSFAYSLEDLRVYLIFFVFLGFSVSFFMVVNAV